jgi:hypothetical protein
MAEPMPAEAPVTSAHEPFIICPPSIIWDLELEVARR